jgi:hypothetical protein
MSGKDPERLHARIDHKLAALAPHMPSPPAWLESWSCLDSRATAEDRLWVCQLIRSSGTLPEDAGYFLICWIVEQMEEQNLDWTRDPLQTLNIFEACRASERMFAQLLQQHGESDMAHSFLTDRPLHERRREAGRLFFFDPPDPDVPPDPGWHESFLRLVAGSIVPTRPIGSLDHRLTNENGFWEVQVLLPGDQPWGINIEAMREGFERIDSLGWYGAPAGPDDHPYYWVEGEYLERQIFLRISGGPGPVERSST